MAGSPDGNLMTVAQAKARLLELGQRKSEPAGGFGGPLLRAGVLLIGGVLLGRCLDRRDKSGAGGSLTDVLMRTIASAAPMLIEQLLRASPSRAPATEPSSANVAAASPDTPADDSQTSL